jgi:hypothetical protein
MSDRSRSLSTARLLVGAAVVTLAVAACGGSSTTPAASTAPGASAAGSQAPAETPAPTTPPTAVPSASAGGSTNNACADPAAMAEAMKNVDHYIATATVTTALPGSSTADLSMDITMKFQKPDRVEMSSGMGAGLNLFSSITIGKDSWISMFGSDTWSKSDSTTSTSSADLFGSSFDASGLEPLDEIPPTLVLPGTSTCVVGYTMKMPEVAADDAANPLAALNGAAAFVVRVDPSTNLPESMGFVLTPDANEAGAPTSMVFVFDYATPVDIQAPDPSKVSDSPAGMFALPSGLDLPSGLTLP